MIRCDRVIVARSGQMVIDRLSLSVGAGEALAIVGPSGAGKSSLLAAVAAANPIHGGDISVAGCSVRRQPDAARARMGYVPHTLVAWPGVRADAFLELFAAAAGLGGQDLHAAVERGLAFAGMQGRGATAIDRLAAGQAKMLLLARALLHAADVLVLDDPFASLDPRQREQAERLIGDLQIGGRTVIAAIDDAQVPECFTHLAVLADGRLVHQAALRFAAFAAGRSWRYRIRCPQQAEEAAAAVRKLAVHAEACDADTLECVLDPAGPEISTIVGAIVRGGIVVEAAGLHPAWTVQVAMPPE